MAEFLQQCGSWGVLATLAAYAAGVWVNRKTGKALFNPLLMGSIFIIVFFKLLRRALRRLQGQRPAGKLVADARHGQSGHSPV